ncbi:unnamed protein product, partial [Rangifer tarandus platyrhynchus]
MVGHPALLAQRASTVSHPPGALLLYSAPPPRPPLPHTPAVILSLISARVYRVLTTCQGFFCIGHHLIESPPLRSSFRDYLHCA